MKINISQSELNNALNVVSKGISTNSTIPVLSGLLLRATNNKLIIESSNLEFSIKSSINANIEAEGEIVVPGKLFSEIIKNLDDAIVRIEKEDNKCVVMCERSSFSTSIYNSKEFPKFPELQINQKINIPYSIIKNMVKKVIKSIARDDSRPVFTGILLEVNKEKIRAVTTDSYRISIAEEKIIIPDNVEEFSVIIPANFLNDACSVGTECEDFEIGINDSQVIINIDNYSFVNRKIEGSFPPYERLLSFQPENYVLINKAQLMAGIKRVSLMKSKEDSQAITIYVNNENNLLELSYNSDESGAAKEIIQARNFGRDLQVSYSITYLMDGLSSIPNDDIVMGLTTESKPAFIIPTVQDINIAKLEDIKIDENNFLDNKMMYLVMPSVQN